MFEIRPDDLTSPLVHALLEEAAARTPGLRKEPPPFVLQTELSDWYPVYKLKAVIEDPPSRPAVLSDLHKNIQDLFNEYGVQIMSPHFVAQPAETVVVAKEHWHAAPAKNPDASET